MIWQEFNPVTAAEKVWQQVKNPATNHEVRVIDLTRDFGEILNNCNPILELCPIEWGHQGARLSPLAE